MAEGSQPTCQLRRRKSSGPNLPLNLETGYQVTEGGPSQGTPSPYSVKFIPDTKDSSSASSALVNFRKKQQSFEINLEDFEEEEIMVDSDGEDGPEAIANRPLTPMPVADFGASVSYAEGCKSSDFTNVQTLETDCTTDVSDAESEGEQ